MINGHRITILLGSFGLGGAERQGLLLAQGLARRHGMTVLLAGLGTSGPVRHMAQQAGLRTICLPRPESRWGWLSWLKIEFIARIIVWQTRPDAVVAFTNPANVVAGRVARNGGVPALWGQRDEGLARFPHWIEQPALEACCYAIANGPGARDFLRRQGVAPERIIDIPNGISLAAPVMDRAGWRNKLGLQDNALVVVMVANLTQAKDHETLLRAWKTIECALSQAHLVLAGAPGDGSELVRNLMSSLGLQRVHLLGSVADVAGLLIACDLAVLSSRSEGQPNAVLEAMSVGLPVVATDISGCRSALGDDPDLIWVPPGCCESLTAALLSLLQDPLLRGRIALKLRLRASSCFSVEAAVDAFADTLKRHLR